MIVLISCGSKKRTYPSAAISLYEGSYFRATRKWASSVTDPEYIYILSAKYGIIRSDRVIPPYEVTIGSRDAISPMDVATQIAALNWRGRLITLAGVAYLRFLDKATDRVLPVNPFVRLCREDGHPASLGYQIQMMKRWHGRVPA
jgi:hypothetical protein